MELIYALLIFFGYMTPSQYTAETNSTFKTSSMIQTLHANPFLFDEIIEETNLGQRVRAIDRTED